MPLRITIEIIPHGDESRKKKLAVVNIDNDCSLGDLKGGGDFANYNVQAEGLLNDYGWDEFATFKVGPLKRGDYLNTCAEILPLLHSEKIPRTRSQVTT